MEKQDTRFTEEVGIFHEHGGMLRFSEALAEGVSEYGLRQMREEGIIERISRGLYRLTDLPPLGNPDLVITARRIPNGVVCLLSALAFHDITTQIPHQVMLALDRSSRRQIPELECPPIRAFWFNHPTHSAGVETHSVDDVPVKVYSPEKTIADCFKFRNKIGIDVALEGLQMHQERHGVDVDALMEFARLCRVHNVIRPYLEATL